MLGFRRALRHPVAMRTSRTNGPGVTKAGARPHENANELALLRLREDALMAKIGEVEAAWRRAEGEAYAAKLFDKIDSLEKELKATTKKVAGLVERHRAGEDERCVLVLNPTTLVPMKYTFASQRAFDKFLDRACAAGLCELNSLAEIDTAICNLPDLKQGATYKLAGSNSLGAQVRDHANYTTNTSLELEQKALEWAVNTLSESHSDVEPLMQSRFTPTSGSGGFELDAGAVAPGCALLVECKNKLDPAAISQVARLQKTLGSMLAAGEPTVQCFAGKRLAFAVLCRYVAPSEAPDIMANADLLNVGVVVSNGKEFSVGNSWLKSTLSVP